MVRQKSPSLYKHAVHNWAFQKELERAYQEMAKIQTFFPKTQLQEKRKKEYEANLNKYIRDVFHKKSLLMREIMEMERLLSVV